MKTDNIQWGDNLDAIRGRGSVRRSTPKMVWRDAAGTEAEAEDVTWVGVTITDNEDGTIVATVGGAGGGGEVSVNGPIVANVSNPPTQDELEDAIGSAPSEVPGQWYVLTDSDTGLHYGVVSNGELFLYWPLEGSATGEITALATATGTTNGFHSMHSSFAYDATSGLVFGAYLNADSDVMVAAWNTDGTLAQGPTELRATLDPDDSHAVPVLLIRSSDRKVVVWYSAHNGAAMYQRISSAAADVSAFAAEADLDAQLGGSEYTYPQAAELTDGIYLFYRRDTGSGGPNMQWAYSKSTNGGTTWAAETLLTKEPTHWSYLSVSKTAADRLDIMFVDRSTFDEAGGSLYHFYMLAGSDIFQTDGTEITAAKPIAAASMTKVWASNGSQRATPWGNVILGSDGRPRLVFTMFTTVSPEDASYIWARWLGSGWFTTTVAAAGSGSQTATAVLEPDGPNAVWYSKDDGTIAEIFRATTTDQGATWVAEQVTDGSTQENALLFPIWNAPSVVKVGWQRAASWARNATVAATFYMAGVVFTASEIDVGRIIILDGENFGDGLAEMIFRISATGALEFSIDSGTTWYGVASGIDGGGGAHVHVANEPFVGDGATLVFYLAAEAELDSVEAFVAGALTQLTQDSTELDKVTFSAAPASGTHYFRYIAATA